MAKPTLKTVAAVKENTAELVNEEAMASTVSRENSDSKGQEMGVWSHFGIWGLEFDD